jgi:DNA repair photolyase
MIELQVVNQKPYQIKGRGSLINPPNRFESLNRGSQAIYDFGDEDEVVSVKTKIIESKAKSIINKVESDDVGLGYSMNPYQGCEHGCVYCYARNTHPYWGYSSGLDFETTIIAKINAADLLDKKLSSKRWKREPIMLSGNTDCYQPIEKDLQLTRSILLVFLKHKHPVSIVTKNALILRDLDILMELNKYKLVNISISINTLDDDTRRLLEPRASSIPKRLDLVKKLTAVGLPVTVLAAPIIPGITDNDIIPLVKKVAELGVRSLHHIVVRLNGDLKEIFEEWLTRNYNDKKEKVLHKIQSLHNGSFGSSVPSLRMKGDGPIAEIIGQQFKLAKKLYMMN